MGALSIAYEKLRGDLSNTHRYGDNDMFLYLYTDGDYCTVDHELRLRGFTYMMRF